MNEFLLYIATAFALVFVIEGLAYAIFPEGVKRMMNMAINAPTKDLRAVGAAAAATGFLLVWLLHIF